MKRNRKNFVRGIKNDLRLRIQIYECIQEYELPSQLNFTAGGRRTLRLPDLYFLLPRNHSFSVLFQQPSCRNDDPEEPVQENEG